MIKGKKSSVTSVTAPQFPNPMALAELSIIDLVSDADYANFKISGIDLSYAGTKDTLIECAQFSRVALTGTTFSTCRLSDIRFDGCDGSNGAWTDCKLTRVEFVDCKFTGLKLIDNQLWNILFEKCIGKLIQMCGSVFKRVTFNECQFAGVDFSDCSFEETIFSKCDLREAIFYNAKLAGTDFRTSDLMGLKVFAPDLNGVIIQPHQALELAPQLASLLGIEVKDA